MPLAIPPFEYRLEGIGVALEFSEDAPEPITEESWGYLSSSPPEKIKFKIAAELPDDWQSLFPLSERAEPPIQGHLVVECIAMRDRVLIPLQHDAKKMSGEIELSSKKFGGTVTLRVVATRCRTLAEDAPGLAKRRGSILATSREYIIHLGAVPEERGGDLKTMWKAFSDLEPPASDYTDAIHWLDTEQTPPILYLNELLPEDLRAALSVMKTRGHQALIRDSFMKPVVADVWEQLINSAIKDLRDIQSFDELKDWKKRVLSLVARGLTGKMDQEDALSELKESCLRDDDDIERLILRIPLYVQEKSELKETFTKAAAIPSGGIGE